MERRHTVPLSNATRDIEVTDLGKRYGASRVLHDVSFTLRDGEFLTLLGPSGSGKTTSLGIIAGFVHPDRGDVRIGGRSIVELPPRKRNLGIVFQNYALFPHLTVRANVESRPAHAQVPAGRSQAARNKYAGRVSALPSLRTVCQASFLAANSRGWHLHAR